LIRILDYLKRKLRRLERIGIYANAKDILQKEVEELKAQLAKKKNSHRLMTSQKREDPTRGFSLFALFFLPMKKGMAWRKGRLLKVDAYPMDGRSEEMVPMSTLLNDSVKRLF
jgi:hypothetical protein